MKRNQVQTDDLKQGSVINNRILNTQCMSFHMGQQDLLQRKGDQADAVPNAYKVNFSLNEDDESEIQDLENDDEHSGGDTKSDTSSDRQASHNESTFGMMLDLLQLGSCDSFVVDCQAGLSGNSVLAKFPCILDGSKFFVWLGSTEISLFGKTTLMNLANLAEAKGAKELYLILDNDHVEIKQFLRMFKVIDAERVRSAQVQTLIRKELKAKMLDVAFYKIDL